VNLYILVGLAKELDAAVEVYPLKIFFAGSEGKFLCILEYLKILSQ
jgi:hypothetical protein